MHWQADAMVEVLKGYAKINAASRFLHLGEYCLIINMKLFLEDPTQISPKLVCQNRWSLIKGMKTWPNTKVIELEPVSISGIVLHRR